LVEKSKDVAAGAVLISAVGAAVIALLILCPPLLAKIGWTH
jgi:diacylglycerol kinase